MKKPIQFFAEPYKTNIIFSDSVESLQKLTKVKYDDDCGGFTIGIVNDLGHFHVVVFADTQTALVHESIHAAWRVLDQCGVRIDAENHESLTYLAEDIYRKCQGHKLNFDSDKV